jgi:hypothetical protein
MPPKCRQADIIGVGPVVYQYGVGRLPPPPGSRT